MRVILSFFLALIVTKAYAVQPESYPGFMWGNVTNDFNRFEGVGFQGVASQAVQWVTLPGDIKFRNYVSYMWRLREDNRDYYDAYGPALGAELSWDFLTLGADYEWRTIPNPHETTENFYLYLTWYKRVDLAKFSDGPHKLLGIPVLGYPITTWGQVFNDFNRYEGVGTQGWMSLGAEWYRLPQDIIFKTLATYRWRFRKLNQDYYDAHGPGVGIEFSRKSVDLGVQYSWMKYPMLDTSLEGWFAYLTWYLDWDLKKQDSAGKN